MCADETSTVGTRALGAHRTALKIDGHHRRASVGDEARRVYGERQPVLVASNDRERDAWPCLSLARTVEADPTMTPVFTTRAPRWYRAA